MLNKKGIDAALNTITVVLLVSFVFFFVFRASGKGTEAISDSTRLSACKLSIEQADQSKYGTYIEGGRPKLAPECDRGVLELTEDIIKNGEINELKYNKIMADAILQAWDAIGRGQYDPRSDWNVGKGFNSQQDMFFCIIWDEIKFSKNLQKYFDNKKNKDKYLSVPIDYMCSQTPTDESSQTYCEIIFGTNSIPEEIEYEFRNTKVDHGSVIVLRLYKGDLADGGALIHPLMYFSSKCESCTGIWSLSIVPSNIPFSNRMWNPVKKGMGFYEQDFIDGLQYLRILIDEKFYFDLVVHNGNEEKEFNNLGNTNYKKLLDYLNLKGDEEIRDSRFKDIIFEFRDGTYGFNWLFKFDKIWFYNSGNPVNICDRILN